MKTAPCTIDPILTRHANRVALEGDLGILEAQAMELEFTAVIAKRPRRFSVDLAQVTMLSSIAITQLLALHRALQIQGGRLVLIDPSPRAFDTLRRIRLTDVFNILMTI